MRFFLGYCVGFVCAVHILRRLRLCERVHQPGSDPSIDPNKTLPVASKVEMAGGRTIKPKCVNFALYGACKFGDKCRNSHVWKTKVTADAIASPVRSRGDELIRATVGPKVMTLVIVTSPTPSNPRKCSDTCRVGGDIVMVVVAVLIVDN